VFSLRVRVVGFVAAIQAILFVAHWFVYETWTHLRADPDPPGITHLQVALAVLSVSFVGATLLAFRYSNLWVRWLYSIASVWLGVLNFCFVAACACWVVYLGSLLFGLRLDRPAIAGTLFGLAMLTSIYGIINARWVRVKRIKVALASLPPSWRGWVAALGRGAGLRRSSRTCQWVRIHTAHCRHAEAPAAGCGVHYGRPLRRN
jgi:hypothetical protein